MNYVIENTDTNSTYFRLFWTRDGRWVSISEAAVYSYSEHTFLNCPLFAKWVELPNYEES